MNNPEWVTQKIEVREIKDKSDRYFSAFCPICGNVEQSSIESSDEIARDATKNKVITHIQKTHKDLL
jgi:hypothetical protein